MKSLSTLLYEYAFSTDGNRLKRPSIEMTIEEFCDENIYKDDFYNDEEFVYTYEAISPELLTIVELEDLK